MLFFLEKNFIFRIFFFKVPIFDLTPVSLLCSMLDSLVTKAEQINCLEYWFV